MSSFSTPKVSLQPTATTDIRTLPDLVNFHVQNNPQHLFCLQAEKNPRASGYDFVPVSYDRLHRALLRCQAWLGDHAPGFHSPVQGADGVAVKSAPIALLMESDVSLTVYMLALMAMGIPALLLSTRLSPLSIQHLVRTTGAKLVIVSSRLHPLILESFPTFGDGNHPIPSGGTAEDGEQGLAIRVAAKYESLFLEEGQVADSSTIAHPLHYVGEEDRQVTILHSSGSSGLPKPIYCSHRYFLGFSVCHDFVSDVETQGVTISTSPFFHGFGMVPICLSLGIGKTFCIPPSSIIPTGASIATLIEEVGARALLTVPSILEEIASLENDVGLDVLRNLDFIAFGGGIPKAVVGERLAAEGVNLINHYGATEAGALTPFFVPPKGHDWRLLRLRQDTLGPLEVRLDPIDQPDQPGQAYKLSLRPFGWTERFELQDLLVNSTGDPGGEFSIAGRVDDLICLATGEKVRPTILEDHLNQHKSIKAVTTFGDNQFELGVIVESSEPLEPDQIEAFTFFIWPTIDEANQHMDSHARISSPTAVLVVPPGALPKSDKGTVPRREAAEKFASEIAGVYRDLEGSAVAQPIDLSSPASSIRALIADHLDWRVPRTAWTEDRDFFELGMDSLQATKLRRILAASVKVTVSAARGSADGSALAVREIPDAFVYQNPSIEKLVQALLTKPSTLNAVPTAMHIDELVDKYSLRDQDFYLPKSTVVVTGATGSLGAHFLRNLLEDPSVGRVVCLNRAGKGSPMDRQRLALSTKGLSISDDAWCKVVVHTTDTAAPRLGLSEAQYEQLVAEVTHVMHIAWPMSFKMSLSSFGESFRTLQNLIQLVTKVHCRAFRQRPRMLFISSFSTVGNYPSLREERFVPETFVENTDWTLDLGYAQAKLVCEKMIKRAKNSSLELQIGLVRVGQLAGATDSGYWNIDEHFVALVRSSQKIGKFPDLRGTLSWLPVDLASATLAEILLSTRPLQPVYHLENPARQSWQETVSTLTNELGIEGGSIIPVQDWLELVDSVPEAEEGNPAKNLVEFLRRDFTKMSCGDLVLDTSVARNSSPTLRKIGPVGADTVRAYVAYWRSINALE